MTTANAEMESSPEAQVAAASAPSASEPPAGSLPAVIALGSAHGLHDSYAAFLSPLLPGFISALGLSNTQAGLLTVFTLGPSVLQPIVGHLSDRSDLRWVVILAPALTGTAMSLLGIAPSYGVLVALLLAAGLSIAGFHAVGPAMAGHFSRGKLGGTMGVWMAGGEIGSMLGPLAIVAGVKWLGMPRTPWLMIAGWLGAVALYLSLRRVPPGGRASGPAIPWRNALRDMGPVLLPLTGILLGRGALDAVMFTYMPVYLTEQGADLWLAGGALSMMELAGVVGVMLAGPASDRWGRRPVLFVCMLVAPLTMAAFVALGGWARIPLLLLLGLSEVSMLPVMIAIVLECCPANPALASGVYQALMFGSRPLAVLVIGALSDLFSLRISFAASAGFSLLCLPLVFWLPRRAARTAE